MTNLTQFNFLSVVLVTTISCDIKLNLQPCYIFHFIFHYIPCVGCLLLSDSSLWVSYHIWPLPFYSYVSLFNTNNIDLCSFYMDGKLFSFSNLYSLFQDYCFTVKSLSSSPVLSPLTSWYHYRHHWLHHCPSCLYLNDLPFRFLSRSSWFRGGMSLRKDKTLFVILSTQVFSVQRLDVAVGHFKANSI